MVFLTKFKTKLFGSKNDKTIQSLRKIVDQVNALEEKISKLSDTDLQNKTTEFRSQLKNKTSLDTILPEAFAVVREASKRVLNMRHFDVQILGGIVMHQGRIAEMKTGEGKTLVSTLPAYLNALEGNGVYVVTVNEYLAKRDSEWMGELFQFLGLSVGLVNSSISQENRKKAYACDIIYGTNNEFGFDYLRDNLASNIDEFCQTNRHFAIIDEVDSILIDEARTPLIISGPIPDSTAKYKKVVSSIKKLIVDVDFTLDEKNKNAIMTEEGIEHLEKLLKIDNLYATESMDLAHMALQCLKAFHLYKKDMDYVVKDGTVMIVDEFTGRILDGRRYSDGLHQAIEALENVKIQEESQTLASITYQNYFRMFPKCAGMTGTALTEEEEFIKIYGLDVVSIPTNKTIQRQDLSDIVYKNQEQKFKAIVEEVKTVHATGQPILIGTITIAASELLSKCLKKEGIKHTVLNAKFHDKEAEIISKAGEKSSVTIATNMAGRGTDIVLGDGVKDLGGLYVIGSERHESRRIDNQLRGRSGRQGDAGKSRFYVALDDSLMRLFGSGKISTIMEKLGMPDDTPIEHGMISKSIERAQKKVEQYHFSVRKQILEYDNVMDQQRNTVYDLRLSILKKDNLEEKIKDEIQNIVKDNLISAGVIVKGKELPTFPKEQIRPFCDSLQTIFPIKNIDEIIENKPSKQSYLDSLSIAMQSVYELKKKQYGSDLFNDVSCMILLQLLDSKWMDHLHNMDLLREGIGLRAYGQKDPLMEYKSEGFHLFKELLKSIYSEAISYINRVDIQSVTDNQAPPKQKSKKTKKKYNFS